MLKEKYGLFGGVFLVGFALLLFVLFGPLPKRLSLPSFIQTAFNAPSETQKTLGVDIQIVSDVAGWSITSVDSVYLKTILERLKLHPMENLPFLDAKELERNSLRRVTPKQVVVRLYPYETYLTHLEENPEIQGKTFLKTQFHTYVSGTIDTGGSRVDLPVYVDTVALSELPSASNGKDLQASYAIASALYFNFHQPPLQKEGEDVFEELDNSMKLDRAFVGLE